MKTKKALKILILAFTVAVLAIGFCFAASATEEASELSVSIIKKNVSYSDYVKVLFAVDDTNAGGNEIELLYYFEDPTVNPNAEVKYGAVYDRGYTDDNGKSFPAFYSAGFPAKEIGEKVYARAHIVGTDVYSEVVRYSVVEYLLERLYVDKATGDKKALYEDLLSYGASAQKVLINGNSDPADDITKFITDYVLVGIEGGTLDGRYDQGIYFVDDVINPRADGVATWNATVYDHSTGVGTTTEVNNEADYTVTGFTMFAVATETLAYKPDLTDTDGRILWDEKSTPTEYQSAKVIDFWMGSGAALEIVDGAPYGESSKVLHMETKSSGSQDQVFIKTTKSIATPTTYIFETDMMVEPNGVTCNYEFIFQNSTVESAQRTAYRLYLSVATGGNGQISGSGFDAVTVPDVAGSWFRLRAEYTDVSDTEAKMVVYYNDTKVAESAAFTKSHAAGVLNQAIIAAYGNAVGDAYFDNTKAAQYTPPYVPDMSDLASRETYEDGDSLNMFNFDVWNGGSSDCTLGIVDGSPYGESSKVYEYVTVSGYTPEVGFKPTKVSGSNTFFYETDMMLDISSNTYVTLEIRGNSSNGVGYKFYLKVLGTGIVLLDSAQNTITSVGNVGEWFRIGAEYVESGDTKTVKLYINGKQVGGEYSGTLSVSLLEKFRFYTNKADVGQIYFDNTKVYFAAE